MPLKTLRTAYQDPEPRSGGDLGATRSAIGGLCLCALLFLFSKAVKNLRKENMPEFFFSCRQYG